jgi:two-component system sensor histidine kinase KdpD
MRRAEMRAETDRLRTALLTSISHDFRTPLASILGNVTSVRHYGHLYDDATRSEMLGEAESETLRLSRFVDSLLQMTRIEAGVLKPKLEPIDLSDVIGSSLKRMEKALIGHAVHVQSDKSVPMLMLDFVLTEQVIANLLDNAAKYSAPETTIEIVVTVLADIVCVQVRDEGPGVAPEDAERIFERFFRVEATDRRPAGTGLGLAICRGFAEAMGGSIGVANRSPGPGAEFTIRFPIHSIGPAER